MHVADLMHGGDAVPRVGLDTRVPEMLREMTSKGFGFTAVVDAAGAVAGIFTDGDLRRLIETGADLRGLAAREVMHGNPKRIRADALAVEAADLMEQHRITGLVVVDAEGRLTGVLNSNDLMRAKVI
jgi:arabinose-5-phosphate isomerase